MIAAFRSVRELSRHWTLTAISAFSLSVAMALGVIALGVSNTALLLPPAAPDPGRLVTIYHRGPAEPIEEVSYPDFEYYRRNNHVFTDVAAAPHAISVSVDWDDSGREIKTVSRPVSENYFAVLGIRPFLGRLFAPGDDDAKVKVAVMTYACWRRLGADPNIVGKVIGGNTIVGVTPKEFGGAFYGLNGDLITSLAQFDNDPLWRTHRDARRFFLTARLKPGVDRSQAKAEMAALSGQLASTYPESKNRAAVVDRATLLPPDALPTAEFATAILLGLVLLVLLIACANVSNLLLAVAVARRRQAAIKLALGAPRGRLVREFLAESTVLCAVSGLAGYGLAAAAIARFSTFTVAFPMYGSFAFGLHLRLDATVVGLAVLLTAIASLATGLAPALYASSPALAQILGGELVDGGPRKGARRNALLIVQVAVATLVLIGMGLCQRNLYNLRHTDPGFSARNLVAASVYLRAEGYDDETKGREFYQTLRRTAAALPGVESVTLASHLPLLGSVSVPVEPPGGGKQVTISDVVVDSDYFSTLGIRILAGRPFDATDHENGPAVVVVNRKMADEFFPGQDAVGRTITAGEPARKFTIVGVAANGRYEDLDEPQHPFLYFPLSQAYQPGIEVIARTDGDPRLWVAPFKQSLHALGLKIMVQPVTLESWMNLTLLGQRVAAGCVSGLSALGLLLAVLGLAGAISYSVSQRTRELGIRIALGAQPGQLLRMVIRQTLRLAGAGVVIGILAGIAATAAFRSQLFEIGIVEWTVLVPVAAAMLAISLAVAYWSARPWVDADPLEAIRHA